MLFLGYCTSPALTHALSSVDFRKVALFIQDENIQYLSEVVYAGESYVGKFADQISSIEHLTLLETNIFSILKKLIPTFPFEDSQLLLFPIETPRV